jgi:hypothetical protein
MYWYLEDLHNETISRNNLDEILRKKVPGNFAKLKVLPSLFRISQNKKTLFRDHPTPVASLRANTSKIKKQCTVIVWHENNLSEVLLDSEVIRQGFISGVVCRYQQIQHQFFVICANSHLVSVLSQFNNNKNHS